MTAPDTAITDNTAEHRYEITSGGELAGFAEYRDEPGARRFTHTVVDPKFEGQGLGSRLARHALDDVRARGLKVVPQCKFIAAWITKHPDYEDLVRTPG